MNMDQSIASKQYCKQLNWVAIVFHRTTTCNISFKVSGKVSCCIQTKLTLKLSVKINLSYVYKWKRNFQQLKLNLKSHGVTYFSSSNPQSIFFLPFIPETIFWLLRIPTTLLFWDYEQWIRILQPAENWTYKPSCH